jgi:hypothetical protein
MGSVKIALLVFCSFLGGTGFVALLQNANKPTQPEVSQISLDSIRDAEQVDQPSEPGVKTENPTPVTPSQTQSPRAERNVEPSFEPTPAPQREAQKQPAKTPKSIWVPVANDTYTVDLPSDPKGFQNGVFFYDPITMIDHQGHTRQGFTPDCKFWYNPNSDRRVPNPGLACKVVMRTQTQY